MQVGADKLTNIAKAQEMVLSAASNADIVVLPEVWNSPYATQSFPVYAEPIPEVGGIVNQKVCSLNNNHSLIYSLVLIQ